MKSLSSSRREVLVDCFHVYTYYIGYLLPRSAVQQPQCRTAPPHLQSLPGDGHRLSPAPSQRLNHVSTYTHGYNFHKNSY